MPPAGTVGCVKRVHQRRAEYLARLQQQGGRPPEPERDRRAERAERRRAMGELVSSELDSLFAPSHKHVHERKEWVAVAKMDDRESGAGPIDLDSGVIELPRTRDDAGERE